jgi:hypothetical protein
MDLKTSLSCNNRKSILSLCEYGENKAIDIYNSVLKNYTALLNIDQQKILTLQLAMIQKDHGTLKDMRNNLIPVTK